MAGLNYAQLGGGLLGALLSSKANRAFQGQQRGLQSALNESYTNPSTYYNKEYSALDKTFYKDMMAQAAAKGRATDAYKMGIAREAAFQKHLGDYRQGIQNRLTANSQMQPTMSRYGAASPWMTLAGSLFGDQVDKDGRRTQSPATQTVNKYVGQGLDSAYGYLNDLFRTKTPTQYNVAENQPYPDYLAGTGVTGEYAANKPFYEYDFNTPQTYDQPSVGYNVVDQTTTNDYSRGENYNVNLSDMFKDWKFGSTF